MIAKFVALMLLASQALPGQDAQRPEARLREAALRVIDLEGRRQLPSATVATIDSLLSLYSEAVVYEHPGAGAVIRGKAELRRGMSRFTGSVRDVVSETPVMTIGHDVVIVETRARMLINDDGKWVSVSRHGIRVIEFDGQGLVRRLIEYPW